jgi:hypothetical protein
LCDSVVDFHALAFFNDRRLFESFAVVPQRRSSSGDRGGEAARLSRSGDTCVGIARQRHSSMW